MVTIGQIYNIGIGLGASADCKVVELKTIDNQRYAVLEMLDYCGPSQTLFVASLEESAPVSRTVELI